jgi:hypothetical protein
VAAKYARLHWRSAFLPALQRVKLHPTPVQEEAGWAAAEAARQARQRRVGLERETARLRLRSPDNRSRSPDPDRPDPDRELEGRLAPGPLRELGRLLAEERRVQALARRRQAGRLGGRGRGRFQWPLSWARTLAERFRKQCLDFGVGRATAVHLLSLGKDQLPPPADADADAGADAARVGVSGALAAARARGEAKALLWKRRWSAAEVFEAIDPDGDDW